MNDMQGSGMMTEAIASFRVRIDSVRNATWQGVVEIDGVEHPFQSELQFLHRVMEQFPALQPKVTWDSNN